MRAYNITGPGGVASLTPPLADYVNSYSLDGTNAETVTWPTGAKFCNISGTATYYVRTEGTAAVPLTDITDGTASARNAAQRQRGDNENSFSVISGTAQVLTVEFWASAAEFGD